MFNRVLRLRLPIPRDRIGHLRVGMFPYPPMTLGAAGGVEATIADAILAIRAVLDGVFG